MTEIKTKLVRCKICGEIFDSSLEKCPVCNAGPEFFEPVEDSGSGFSADTQQRYFILGSGPAAVNAAEAIRKRDATGNILILSEEEVLPYNRPMLTKNMFSEPQQDKFAIKNGMRREIFSCFWAEEWSPSIPKQRKSKQKTV